MNDFLKSKKNLINTLILLILILAIPLGINLVKQQQILRSRATAGVEVSFRGPNVTVRHNKTFLKLNAQGEAQVDLEITSPLGLPGASTPGGPTPTSPPAGGPTTIPTPTPRAGPTPTTTPTTTPRAGPTPTTTPTTPSLTSLCADGSNDKVYSSNMVGCNGSVSGPDASLCSPSAHVCSVAEYVSRGGNAEANPNDRVRYLSSTYSTQQWCSLRPVLQPGGSEKIATSLGSDKYYYDTGCGFANPGWYGNAGGLWDGVVCCRPPTSPPTPTPTPTPSPRASPTPTVGPAYVEVI